ncbi:MAG TPA: NADH-ubiquinone oxidoreductase-F iron-sulfur binding region domain-containing protein [Candidatus Acidoferrales bacterium]|nr:NADH-ubiquinone oxidoreductase-F iron-sulfur binding region domain-containing protein [Candidatus Acidoferrales bacterium]
MIVRELRAVQSQFGFLPADQLQALAKKIDVPITRLHQVASFFPHFRLTPPPRADVRVCRDMSCHLRGADRVRMNLEERFKGASEQDVTIRGVSCLGQCDHAVAVSINDRAFAPADEARVEQIVRDVMLQGELPKAAHHEGEVECASNPYSGGGRYGALRRLVESRGWNAALESLKAAGLRGLGGAGFPTEMKWQLVRQQPGNEKYIVCNADESEPGTFKDRFILTHLPFLVIEGVIIAGLITGARKGILYIRHEYEAQEHLCEQEIHRCYEAGLLGAKILGTDLAFDLEVFVSPGGYICGEESALLEAIEGKRAEPRNKPPFPGQQGLWNKPTVINNVETFANVPQILARGVEWYKAQGVSGTSGLKFVGVSGDIERPGVYELPMGTPMSDLIFRHAGGVRGGKKLKAFAPSGPSSGYLPASMVDVHLDFKSLADAGSMLGSGAVVVCAEGTCMLDMALSATQFFRNESCGKCVPCRVGSQKMVDILAGWSQGRGSEDDLALVQELSQSMVLTSICGLGQVVPAPIGSVLKYFREEVEAHITRRECPSGICFSDAPARSAPAVVSAAPRLL